MHDQGSSGNVLVVVSSGDGDFMRFIQGVISAHQLSSLWFVFDRKIMERIASTELMSKIPADRVIVFSGRNPEETSMRVYAITRPAKAYVCDPRGILKPIVDFLYAAKVEVETC